MSTASIGQELVGARPAVSPPPSIHELLSADKQPETGVDASLKAGPSPLQQIVATKPHAERWTASLPAPIQFAIGSSAWFVGSTSVKRCTDLMDGKAVASAHMASWVIGLSSAYLIVNSADIRLLNATPSSLAYRRTCEALSIAAFFGALGMTAALMSEPDGPAVSMVSDTSAPSSLFIALSQAARFLSAGPRGRSPDPSSQRVLAVVCGALLTSASYLLLRWEKTASGTDQFIWGRAYADAPSAPAWSRTADMVADCSGPVLSLALIGPLLWQASQGRGRTSHGKVPKVGLAMAMVGSSIGVFVAVPYLATKAKSLL